MVRRWSRINDFNFSLKNKKLFFFKKSSKSRVFKLTVSTRKFFKKYTKFRRKAFNRLRHKTNWLLYSNVLKFWSHDYLKTRTFGKKFLLNNVYTYNLVSFNWSSTKNLNIDLFFNVTYSILNLNALIFKKNINTSSVDFFFWKNFKNISIAMIEDISDLDMNPAPSLFYYDKFFYEFDNNPAELLNYDFFIFFKTNDQMLQIQILNFYKFFIYLTFLDF